MASINSIAAARLRKRLHAATGGRCFYCGIHTRLGDEPLPRDWLVIRRDLRFVIEHKTARTRGGHDHVDNMVASCSTCNTAKGSLSAAEFRLLHGLRAGNLSFAFALEPKRPARDWLCCHSKAFERSLFVQNAPDAANAYSRGWLSRAGRPSARQAFLLAARAAKRP